MLDLSNSGGKHRRNMQDAWKKKEINIRTIII
jgi:hypothetical protein